MAEHANEPRTVNLFDLTESTWLGLVSSELEASIGFGGDGEELQKQRAKALEYLKGEMGLPELKNRSKVTDTALSDAIETLMPDLMEVLASGDDVAAFQPTNEEDIERADQETKAIVQTVMEDNDGFIRIYDYCKDALLLKTGIFKVQWQDETTDSKSIQENVPLEHADNLVALYEQGGVKASVVDINEENQTANIEIINTEDDSTIGVSVVAPEDFTVGSDTLCVSEATYVAEKSKQRAQALIAQGFDADKVDKMSEGPDDSDEEDEARDTVEIDDADNDPAKRSMRLIEMHEHHIRFDPDDNGKLKIYQVITDASESILLSVEEVDKIPYAVGTPYRNPHRFYGTSVADLVMEVQAIKTSILRMLLDSGYFALNQRNEIVVGGMTAKTMSAYMKNEPGSGIPVKTAGTIVPIGNAGLGFDAIAALEYISTVGEARTGIVRNAQGLNPDTLHDTAAGAKIMISAAQKRTRLIARLLADGIKDMFLLTHDLMRGNGANVTLQAGGKFQQVDASQWVQRKRMNIKVGMGAGGKEQKIGALSMVLERQAQGIELQGGGVDGPFVTKQNVFKAVTDLAKAAGLEGDRYFSNPETQQPQQQGEEGPSEAEIKAQGDAQKLQADAQASAAKLQQDGQIKQAQIASTERGKAAELQSKGRQAQQELALRGDIEAAKLRQSAIEAENKLELEAEEARAQTALAVRQQDAQEEIALRTLAVNRENNVIKKLRPGGDIDK